LRVVPKTAYLILEQDQRTAAKANDDEISRESEAAVLVQQKNDLPIQSFYGGRRSPKTREPLKPAFLFAIVATCESGFVLPDREVVTRILSFLSVVSVRGDSRNSFSHGDTRCSM
jgi:hypothetical protein